MRIVTDTNIIIASVFWSGIPYQIILSALDGFVEIFTSREIVNEVRKVLSDPKERFQLSEQEIDDLIQSILLCVKLVEPKVQVQVVQRDPTDNVIIACALAAQAQYIITRDKDLLELKEYNKIKIVSPEEFIRKLL